MLIRKRLTRYPWQSAMRGCLEITCFGGYLCVFPPGRFFGQWHHARAYWSPNGTPWHHGMRPLWRSRKAAQCSCGAPDCPNPTPAEQEDRAC